MKRQAFSLLSRLNPWQQLLLSAVLVTLAAPAAAQLRAPGTRTQGIFTQQGSQSASRGSTVAPSQPMMGVPQPSSQPRSQLVDEVVAVVNNSVITRRNCLTAPTRSKASCAPPSARCRRGPTCSAKCWNAS
jgi:peptidyl-prolyl cis-trans isomerase SurA